MSKIKKVYLKPLKNTLVKNTFTTVMYLIRSGPLFLLKDLYGCFIVVYMEHAYLYHVNSKRYQIVIVTRNYKFEILKSVIVFRRCRTCTYCELYELLHAKNSSFEIYMYRTFF